MRSYRNNIRMWSVTVAALLWFAAPAGAIPLESWDDKQPIANQRFKVLSEFTGEAVLDKETQLVWEQSPALGFVDWSSARVICINKNVGGRKGWRLPSIAELASLVDLANNNPALPTGHPFSNVQSANYWSASTNAVNPAFAWFVHFINGDVNATGKTVSGSVWCVRGGMNADRY